MANENEARTAREEWGTRFGFLMAMLGGMVGSGNIWRMPYTTGQNGGGAFLLAYIILLFVIAIPGLMAETALGSYTKQGVIGAFKKTYGRGWSEGFGLVVVVVTMALTSYYLPVVGQVTYYVAHSFLLTFSQPGFESVAFWNEFTASPLLTIGTHTIATVLVGGVLLFGIKRGIERVVKWMIPLLVVTLIVVAVRGLTLPGATAGLAFVLTPDWNYLVRGQTWIAALGQALFSTGLGWGIALTFGSYLRQNDDIPLGAGIFTAIGNTSIGLLSIFAVFPVVFAFGLEPTAGAELTFVSLVSVFPQMAGGPIWAIVFFVGFFFAALSTGIVITEIGVSTIIEETRLDRTQTVLVVCTIVWLLGIPSAYSSAFLGTMDFMFGNWGLPLATLLIIGTVGWKIGPERLRVIELNRNADVYIGSWWNPVIKYVIPLVMVFIMAYYLLTNIAGSTLQTVGGVVLMTVLLTGAVLVMRVVRQRESTNVASGGD
ncbi:MULTISPECIES: sodium-dependent transporter [Halococcus]|uniref:Sodium-and chloride-dependent transporter n=1 Tax=Halococcus salifodinae DSM 8989 TaxID=1227456 RepID=M0NDP0_9EURY|nr:MULTISPECIES: sodium-dependent transporter [Halococcus]EMA55961.1 sodium-and chloride-dependent transporter [Halococcus salifodinae DSM 8989]